MAVEEVGIFDAISAGVIYVEVWEKTQTEGKNIV